MLVTLDQALNEPAPVYVESPFVPWVWVAGEFAVLLGAPGCGKTRLALHLAPEMSAVYESLSGSGLPVLYWAGEQTPGRLSRVLASMRGFEEAERFRLLEDESSALGKPRKLNIVFWRSRSFPPTEYLDSCCGIVIDYLQKLSGNDRAAIEALSERIRDEVQARQILCLMISACSRENYQKLQSGIPDNILSAAAGNSCVEYDSSSVNGIVHSDDESLRTIVQGKTRYQDGLYRQQYDFTGPWTARDEKVLGQGTKGRSHISDKVLKAVAQGADNQKEIIASVGAQRQLVLTTLKDLTSEGLLSCVVGPGSRRRVYAISGA